jgi:hypothetical protein
MQVPRALKIRAKNPVVRPAIEAATFDRFVASEVHFAGTGLNNDPRGGYIRVRRYRVLPDGGEELDMSGDVETISLGDPDNMAAAVDDKGNPKFPKLRALLDAFEPAVEELAVARGIAVTWTE